MIKILCFAAGWIAMGYSVWLLIGILSILVCISEV